MAQRGEDPGVHDVHRPFDEGLVPGRMGAGGEDHRAVMAGEVGVFRIDLALVLVRLRDPALEAVGSDRRRHATEEPERVPVADDEVLLPLGAKGFHVGILARPEDGDEELGFALNTVIAVGTFHAGEVDVEAIPRLVLHRERHFSLCPAP